MEKELFAVVAIYKSEAVDYLRDNNIARENALIINTVEDFEEAKTKLIKDVKLISTPMGLSSNEDDLKKLLVHVPSEVEMIEVESGEVKEFPEGVLEELNMAEVDDKGEVVKEILNEKIDLPIIEGTISEEDSKEAAKILNEKLDTPMIDGESSKDKEVKEIKEVKDEDRLNPHIVTAPPKRETVEPEVEIPNVREVKNPPKTPLKDELKSEKPMAKKRRGRGKSLKK